MSNTITNVLEYKGFIGSIEADTEADILYGHVQNLKNPNDIVSYEGETIKELKEDFRDAIDDYLASFEDESSKEN
ncbi:antitoxin HicB [Butyrivibrio proteoclasticus]|uniref:antitoxin HicB n=1 Tax=Butyrivibrio proteoclasticus TaxID=43305 RepID=UPI0018CC6546|nr:antitoxin HicB [Butyrivibrio proteoclasticus]